MIDYSKKIKEYRESHFLTQEEFAKILGVSATSVTRWETGKFEPTMQLKKKLFELFNKKNIKKED